MLLIPGIILLALNLRACITGVGPLIGALRGATGLSATLIGLLTTLPLLAFGAISPLAPRLARGLGIEVMLLVSLVGLAAGVLLRSLPALSLLFLGTALMGAAIAISNVLLPSLIKREFPGQIGLMTAIYSTLLSASGAIADGVSIPLAQNAGLGWRGSLAFWALPAALTALLWLALLPRRRSKTRSAPALASQSPASDNFAPLSSQSPASDNFAPLSSQAATSDDSPLRTAQQSASGGSTPRTSQQPISELASKSIVSSVWHSSLAWQVTFFMGLQSLIFYATIAWFPALFESHNISLSNAGWLLSLLQLAGVCGSFIAPQLSGRMRSQRPLVVCTILLALTAYAGILSGAFGLIILWCLLLGLAHGAYLSLALLFFILRTPDARSAAELSGMAQSIGYLLAATGPLLFGWLHDLTQGWTIPLLALTALSLVLLVIGLAAGRAAVIKLPGSVPMPSSL